MPDPKNTIDDYHPKEILNEFIDSNDGVKKYTVDGFYFGTPDVEIWTEDEFDKPEHKHLLEEWKKKLEEEDKLDKLNKPSPSKKRIKEIINVHVDDEGKARFTCITVSGNNQMDLNEDEISGKNNRIIHEESTLQERD